MTITTARLERKVKFWRNNVQANLDHYRATEGYSRETIVSAQAQITAYDAVLDIITERTPYVGEY